MIVSDLSPAERALWLGFPRGVTVDLRTGDLSSDDPGEGRGWGPERAVRAEVIASLALGEEPGEAGHLPMVRLRGARIGGELRLAFADVGNALMLEDCWFEACPDLYWASVGFTSFRGSVMPGLRAGNLRVDGHLRLSGCRFSGEVNLLGSKIAGAVLLDGARVINPGGLALDCERAEVGGDISFRDSFVCEGQVRLLSARIGGSLAMAEAQLSAPGDVVLAGDKMQLDGSLGALRAQLTGEMNVRGAVIRGSLGMAGARLSNPGGVALRASRLVAENGVLLDAGFTAEGEVRLSHAHIGRNLVLAQAKLRNHSGPAFAADAAIVEGSIHAYGLDAQGSTDLTDARVAGSVHLQGAQLIAADSRALTAHGVHVGAVMNLCDGFTAHGTVNLTSAHIASQLCFDGGALLTPGGQALKCWRVTVPELVLRPRQVIDGSVSLQHSSVTILHDDPSTWPHELQLDGLTYDVLNPQLPANDRLPWLTRDPRGYSPGPYEQLAAVYRNLGSDKDARTILLAKQRHHRPTLAWYARAWGHIQDLTVGYGYRPLWAALWLLGLLALGTTIFAIHHPPPLSNTPVPTFNPLIYTANLLLPVIDFGQARAFNPHGLEQWLAFALTAAGWILATTAAAGIIRALRRD
jgi:hypothetical protein